MRQPPGGDALADGRRLLSIPPGSRLVQRFQGTTPIEPVCTLRGDSRPDLWDTSGFMESMY
jgi:hypothetical protein